MLAAGETDKAAGIFRKFVFRHRAFTFWRSQFHARQKTAKILITVSRFGEKGMTNAWWGGDLSADVRLHAGFLRRQMQPRRPINSVAIEERNRRHRIFGARADKFFGQGSAFEKAECGAGMKFNVCRAQS